MGAFGQKLPQNVPSTPASGSIKSKGVLPAPPIKDFDHLGPDGLPYPGAIIWPGQVCTCLEILLLGVLRLGGGELGVVLVGKENQGCVLPGTERLLFLVFLVCAKCLNTTPGT